MIPYKQVVNKFKITLILILGLSAFGNELHAHEMWIEPLKFSVKTKGKIFAQHKVGQNFKGNSYAYLDGNFKQLIISENGSLRPIKSRLGDVPFIQEVTNDEGLAIISAISTGNTVTYKTAEQFSKFLKAEKLDWVLAAHKKRGLPEEGFTEIFKRSAKALVKVGHGKGNDEKLGLPLEWVLKSNPYTFNENKLTACLYWHGEKVINKPVHIFHKALIPKANEVAGYEKKVPMLLNKKKYKITDYFLTSDDSGCISMDRDKGIYLLNAVKMKEANTVFNNKQAVWESHWGSLTFSILE